VIDGESFARPLMTLAGSMTAKLPEHTDTPGRKGDVFLSSQIPYAVIWTLVTLMAASRLKETREGTKKAESGF
jgi:hypothetical protein